MIARVLGLIDSPPTRTSPTGESDILHPLLLIFDSRSPSGQRYIPPGVVRRAEEGRIPCEDRPGRRKSVDRLPDPQATVGAPGPGDRQPGSRRIVPFQ